MKRWVQRWALRLGSALAAGIAVLLVLAWVFLLCDALRGVIGARLGMLALGGSLGLLFGFTFATEREQQHERLREAEARVAALGGLGGRCS